MRSNNPEAEGDWTVCASVGLAIPSPFLRTKRLRKAAISSFPKHDHLGAPSRKLMVAAPCAELPCCAPAARLSMRARTSWSGRRQLCKFCPSLRAAAMHLTGSPKERSPEHVDAAVRRGRWFAQGYVATPGGNAVRALVAVGQTGSGPIAIKPVIKTRDHEDDVGANGSARNPGIIACNKKNREHGNGAHCIYVLAIWHSKKPSVDARGGR